MTIINLLPSSCASPFFPAKLMLSCSSRALPVEHFASRDAGGERSFHFWVLTCSSHPRASGSAVQGSQQNSQQAAIPGINPGIPMLLHHKFWVVGAPCVWFLQGTQKRVFQQVPEAGFLASFSTQQSCHSVSHDHALSKEVWISAQGWGWGQIGRNTASGALSQPMK